MPREPQAFHAPDISALARALKQQWAAQEGPPSHLQLLNMLARGTGHQNYQHWKAAAEAAPAARAESLPAPQQAAPEPLDATTTRLLRHFDAAGRMQRWPSKHSDQLLCLWAVAAALPNHGPHREAEVNAALQEAACFGDHVLLRRELVNQGHLSRTPDGRSYWRVRRDLPSGLIPLVTEVRRRRALG